MLPCLIYAYVRKTRYYAHTMAVRWKRYLVYTGIAVIGTFYTAILVSTIGNMRSAHDMLSMSMQQWEYGTTGAYDTRSSQQQHNHPGQGQASRKTQSVCDPLPHQPHETADPDTFRNYRNYRNISELSTVTGDYDSPLAICKLDMRRGSKWMVHFPHVMQHLYACYSYWLDNPSKIPVIFPLGISRIGLERRHSKNAFLKGFMEILESQLGVHILYGVEIEDWMLDRNHTTTIERTLVEGDDNDSNVSSNSKNSSKLVVALNPKIREIHRPLGYVFSHAKRLNEMAQRQYEMGDVGTAEDDSTSTTTTTTNQQHRARAPGSDAISTNRKIRVGILNRAVSSGRSITNAEDLVQSILSEIFFSTDSSNITNNNNTSNNSTTPTSLPKTSSLVVSLKYFEGKNTLEDQIRFFNSIDILVSPHGAQLTGIPFLASKDCAQLIEFFPDRYYMPDFFGSLAIDSGIGYSHVYFSNETAKAQSTKYPTAVLGRLVDPNIERRTQHRSKNLCIDTTVAVYAVRKAIVEWGRCQQRQTRGNRRRRRRRGLGQDY
jgi:hypothetical protein